jgi:XTP/dITP diphosphohydrolase
MRVYVATTNGGKLREMQQIFKESPLELATYPAYEEPLEGDTSYAENAALKARALHAQLVRAGERGAVLADDSGIEVYAINRRPGVLTAYYGGVDAPWPQRRATLLGEVAATGSTDRRARFVCAMHFIGEDEREFAAMGTVDGLVAREERGEAGFSFDPIFSYPALGRTFAEMSDEEKNRVSHRAIAAAGLVAAIEAASGAFP